MNLAPNATLYDYEPTTESFQDAVLNGLGDDPKWLPCRFFYDERGSALFEWICTLDDYYPTRTEVALLEEIGPDLAAALPGPADLIEFGCGSSTKIRVLLQSLDIARYVPIDISRAALEGLADDLHRHCPALEIAAICADYNRPFDIPPLSGRKAGAERAGFFPGSTIGNFAPAAARSFLRRSIEILGPGAAMITGVDLNKDEDVLLAAYNDSEGVTAEFNKNILRRINRELGANFDLSRFRHEALFNAGESRIEMHLVSEDDQSVSIAGRPFEFAAGESIHTENSYKYTVEDFQRLAASAGYEPVDVWCDARAYFSVHLLRCPAS